MGINSNCCGCDNNDEKNAANESKMFTLAPKNQEKKGDHPKKQYSRNSY